MFDDNTKQVNSILVRSLAWCSIGLIALLITDVIGFFHFDNIVWWTLIVVGFATCCVPYILNKAGVSDTFLKYYIQIAMSILIGVLGTNNGIGIYITYILVPIVTCLYFDRKFTIRIGVISYLIMAGAVYINCAGKMEVIYKNWTHLHTFELYMIGFTLEYAISMVFIYQLAKRSQSFLEHQQESLKLLQSENDRRKEMTALYQESLTEQRRTAYGMLTEEMVQFTAEDIARLSTGHQFSGQVQELFSVSDNFYDVMIQVLKNIGEYFGIDRILYVELSEDEQEIGLSYQWARNEKDWISDFRSDINAEEFLALSSAFDEKGYIEFERDRERVGEETIRSFYSEFGKSMYEKMLGIQLWIPTMDNGKYNGSVCFDKYSEQSFQTVDKILLAEIVGMICMNVMRVNADNANRAKSTFLSTMSHEIRTPMNAIIGMTTVAMREEMNDTVRKCLSTIQSSADGLLAIINDILDFSKIESGKVDIIQENYQTLSLLNDVSTMLKARNAEKGLKLIFDIPDNLPTMLYGDMVRIKQVMVNLATNAIKYTDQGSVTVKVSCEKKDAKNLVLVYSVTDTGQGIKEEDRVKLFQSFSQVNQEQNHHKEGTGLGLAISKQLVELMHGHIGVESTYGVGSTFHFEIPQEIIDATPAGALENFEYLSEEAEVEQFELPDAKVLLVDDNKVNLKVAMALFRPYKMQIDTASDGCIAVNMSKEKKYDLILMDNFMPEMDGMEATRAIRADEGNPNQQVPIVALTADVVMGVKEQLLDAGMNDILGKPIDLKAAKKIFRKYLL